MPWILAGILTPFLIAGGLLLERKLRQRRVAGALKIDRIWGIAEAGYVAIGGVEQWISIRGEQRENPVLLVLHGGPGCSYSIFTPHLRPWEAHFTIVQWDQRGAGRTFARAGKCGMSQVTLERLTLDAIEVAEHVCERLGKRKLVLLASSIGSTFGLRVVRRRPDLFHAYVGTDQNVGIRAAGASGLPAVLGRLRALKRTRGLRELSRIGADPVLWTLRDFEALAQWTMKSDPAGFRRTMKLLKNAVWYAPGWGLADIRSFASGMRCSLEQLLPEIARFDAREEGTHFAVPIIFLQGEADVLTTPGSARAFFEAADAPAKRFALIAGAGHFAAFTNPDEFLRQLLIHVRQLGLEGESECAVLGSTRGGGATSL